MKEATKRALVTLAIGEKYQIMFDKYCRRSWGDYCAKYQYDLIVIDTPLDETPRGADRSPAWQKLLILSQDWSFDYDQIVWVDTDIIINSELAPDIAATVPVKRVGAVETYSIPSKEIHGIALQRAYDNWRKRGVSFIDNLTPGQYYTNRGIPGGDLDKVVQTGVFVCSPKEHRAIFEYIYNRYEDRKKSAEFNYEMPAMSYELVKNDLVHWIPSQYNFNVSDIVSAFYPFIFHPSPEDMLEGNTAGRVDRNLIYSNKAIRLQLVLQSLRNIYNLGYFVHFAGCSDLMEILARDLPANDANGKF